MMCDRQAMKHRHFQTMHQGGAVVDRFQMMNPKRQDQLIESHIMMIGKVATSDGHATPTFV